MDGVIAVGCLCRLRLTVRCLVLPVLRRALQGVLPMPGSQPPLVMATDEEEWSGAAP
jgi:hypothetical protein